MFESLKIRVSLSMAVDPFGDRSGARPSPRNSRPSMDCSSVDLGDRITYSHVSSEAFSHNDHDVGRQSFLSKYVLELDPVQPMQRDL